MRTLMFSCVLWLAAGPVAAADLYGELNRQRAGAGRCTSATRLPPLRRQPALEQAARDMARGDTLEHSVAAAGYRATRSSFFGMSGEGAAARASQLLAERGDCKLLMDPGLSEVGIHADARELRVVLAAPFAPAVEMSAQAAGQRVLELVNQARVAPRAAPANSMPQSRCAGTSSSRRPRWCTPKSWRAAITSAIPDATGPIRRSVSSGRAIVIAASARTSRAGRCNRKRRWRAGSRVRRIART